MYVITNIFDFNNIGDNDVKLLTKTHKYDMTLLMIVIKYYMFVLANS